MASAMLTTTPSGRSIIPFPIARRQSVNDGSRFAPRSERGSGRLTLIRPIHSGRAGSHRSTSGLTSGTSVPRFRLMAIGSRQDIMHNIKTLHMLGYAEAFSWSSLQPVPGSHEMMSILTLRSKASTAKRVSQSHTSQRIRRNWAASTASDANPESGR